MSIGNFPSTTRIRIISRYCFRLSVLNINGGTIGASTANIMVADPLGVVGGDFNMGAAVTTNLTLTQDLNLGTHTLTHNGPSSDTLSGSVTNGTITVTAGTLNLTGNNGAYAGTSTVTGGTLNMQGAGVYTGANVVTGGTLNMNGTGGYTGNNTVSGGVLNMNSASVITYSGTTTVTGGVVNLSSAGSTFSGANTISGSGTLNMSGTGAHYTGASNLSGGTLNLSAGDLSGPLTITGGTFNFLGGAYSNTTPLTNPAGAAFTIGPGANMTIKGGFTNDGTCNINTSGTLTSNVTNNTSAATTVNGTLAGDLTNYGILMGAGTITGNVVNNAGSTVNPGNSPGTLTVGTYTINPGATQIEEIASATTYDKIVTTGVGGATLNGGTLSPRPLNGYVPALNSTFRVVQATNGGTVTGAFSGIDNARIGNSRTLFWQLNYTPSTADLVAAGNYTPPDLALSANQRSVGNALNSVAPSTTGGDLLNILDAINALTSNSSVAAAYTEISPAKYAALPTMTMPITHLQFQYLQNRLARERWEAEVGSDAVNAGGCWRPAT
jgi:hypothetical protein